MATLIFVHGTSVRKAGFDDSLKAIRTGLSSALAHEGKGPVGVEGCLWGDSCGVRLNAGGKSVPEYDDRGGAAAQKSAGADPALLWELLGYDSLFEIHGLALRDKKLTPAFDHGAFKGEVRRCPRRSSPLYSRARGSAPWRSERRALSWPTRRS